MLFACEKRIKMESKEILQQYMMGSIEYSVAIADLKSITAIIDTPQQLQESARARYVIGFIRRTQQYLVGQASVKDLCLNIRDIALIFGRLKLNSQLVSIIKEYGSDYGFRCESDNQVSCDLLTPSWLEPSTYIHDVYSLKQNNDNEVESLSPGDTILRTHTIFSTYKSFEQKLAVHTALSLPDGYTLLISQPTGGGKSLVTQMIASVATGLSLVIVPTVALALDQYHAAQNNLKSKQGIFCYRGEQTAQDRLVIIDAIKKNEAKIIFTSPEAILKNTELNDLLSKAACDGYLQNIIVDEAHVVPDWGVFFRPDFQIFSICLRKWRESSHFSLRTYLLSATLSDDVVDTLFKLFGTEGKNKQIRCDALRQEPRFYFHSAKTKIEQEEKTIEAITLLPKPMVVYVLEPRDAYNLHKKLLNIGLRNVPVFTGETKDTERDSILSGWKKQKYDIVIATSAFGIGVDKPDVRTIIHACCPENLSRFYQEVGRGGRDRLPSLSLFLPYQNRYDDEGDVKRALGLVNKRVLTVKRAVIRWNSLLHSPNTIIDADVCVFDTSTTPSTMTEDEAEYAGNRNVAWNVNLLLFLYRIGFIDLIDAKYEQANRTYSIKLRLLDVDALTNTERLSQALTIPRAKEYETQMAGYRIMSEMVSSPKSQCWGRFFKHLFPLSKEVCSGCPVDADGRITTDKTFKLRLDPELQIAASSPSRRLSRLMGSYRTLLIRRSCIGPCTNAEISILSEKTSLYDIGAIVVPSETSTVTLDNKLVMNYAEFLFSVTNCPYLFANGVVCVMSGDILLQSALFNALQKLAVLDYSIILYANDNISVGYSGKPLRECIDGYTVSIDRI